MFLKTHKFLLRMLTEKFKKQYQLLSMEFSYHKTYSILKKKLRPFNSIFYDRFCIIIIITKFSSLYAAFLSFQHLEFYNKVDFATVHWLIFLVNKAVKRYLFDLPRFLQSGAYKKLSLKSIWIKWCKWENL